MTASTRNVPDERPLRLINMTYISDSQLAVEDQANEIGALVWHARRSNEIDGITGALLFTGKHFVQTLEGTLAAINGLMARIERDERHKNVVVIDRHDVATRIFWHWSLAYSGPSVSVERLVERALTGAIGGEQRDVNRLLQLMERFGRPEH